MQYKLKNGSEVWYKQNVENELFELHYKFPFGKGQDQKAALAMNYLNYLGTDKMSAEQFKRELYKLGCDFNVTVQEDKIQVSLNGLNENMEASLTLLEDLFANVKPDENALKDMIDGILKERADAKLDKGTILRMAMVSYAKYGTNSPFTNILKEDQLKSIKPAELVLIIKGLMAIQHDVWYYGPKTKEELTKSIEKLHKTPSQLKPPTAKIVYKEQDFTDNDVYFVEYDMVQAEMIFLSKSTKYDKNLVPVAKVYNEYFGGSMNSIVFQEIRESKALAYASRSIFNITGDVDYSNYNFSYIGAQADKLDEAMAAMKTLLDTFPKSETLFNTSKEAILNTMRTERFTKMTILNSLETYKKLGIDYDLRKEIFPKVQAMTFDDISKFQNQYVKGQKMKILVIGSKDKLNFKNLEKYGKIRELTLKEIFGY